MQIIKSCMSCTALLNMIFGMGTREPEPLVRSQSLPEARSKKEAQTQTLVADISADKPLADVPLEYILHALCYCKDPISLQDRAVIKAKFLQEQRELEEHYPQSMNPAYFDSVRMDEITAEQLRPRLLGEQKRKTE